MCIDEHGLWPVGEHDRHGVARAYAVCGEACCEITDALAVLRPRDLHLTAGRPQRDGVRVSAGRPLKCLCQRARVEREPRARRLPCRCSLHSSPFA
jgi:hypothetical protein